MKLSAPKERLRVKRDFPYLFFLSKGIFFFLPRSALFNPCPPFLSLSIRFDLPSFSPPPSGPIRNPRKKKRRRRRDLTTFGKNLHAVCKADSPLHMLAGRRILRILHLYELPGERNFEYPKRTPRKENVSHRSRKLFSGFHSIFLC